MANTSAETAERKVAVHGPEQGNAAHQAIGGRAGSGVSPESSQGKAEEDQQQVNGDENDQSLAGGGPGINHLGLGVSHGHQRRAGDPEQGAEVEQEHRVDQALENAATGVGDAFEMFAEMVKGSLKQAAAFTGIEDGNFPGRRLLPGNRRARRRCFCPCRLRAGCSRKRRDGVSAAARADALALPRRPWQCQSWSACSWRIRGTVERARRGRISRGRGDGRHATRAVLDFGYRILYQFQSYSGRMK